MIIHYDNLLTYMKEGVLNVDMNNYEVLWDRPLSRRLAPPLPAGIARRRRKMDGAPPNQPNLPDATAAEFFTARRGSVMIMVVKLLNFNAL